MQKQTCSSYLIFVDRPILIEWYQLRVFLPGLNKNPPPEFNIVYIALYLVILIKISLVRIWPDSIFKEGIIFTYSYITQISPCNEDPLTPHLYIVKLACTGVYFFLIFVPKHRMCVHIRTGSNAYPKSMF